MQKKYRQRAGARQRQGSKRGMTLGKREVASVTATHLMAQELAVAGWRRRRKTPGLCGGGCVRGVRGVRVTEPSGGVPGN